jgi:oligopeptide/dipeptide ABC transporter ATP-binding protein
MDRFIEIKNLIKHFYGRGFLNQRRVAVQAVDRVSFGIERNTVFGLVGESGCGKTTLVRSILYLDPPTSGEVWFDGTQLGSLSVRRLRAFRKRIEKLLDLVGIAAAHRSRYPHEFSGGQKQRIVIARALCMEPDFLVLDEPVSNLDVSIQAQIINLLLDLKQELSLTYLFISHDLNLVAYFSDRIGVMYRGRLVEVASTEEMMMHACHPYTLRLFSSAPGKQKIAEEADDDARPDLQKNEKTTRLAAACPYAPECAIGNRSCSETECELREIGAGHRVACFKV